MKDDMDILKEISSIASAHGSRALSEMLGKRINLTLPNLETMAAKKLKAQIAPDQLVISVQGKILSGISGAIVLVLDEKSAFQLVHMCCGKEEKTSGGVFTEMGVSALKEVGNVVMGSFAGALSVFLKHPVIPSIPTLVNGPFEEIVLSMTSAYGGSDQIIVVEACFEEAEKRVKGGLYFVLPTESMEKLQKSGKDMLDELS